MYAVFINLLLFFVAQLAPLRHPLRQPPSDSTALHFLLAVDISLLFYLIINPIPRFIRIDRESRKIIYAFLFRFGKVIVDYDSVWTEWIMIPAGRSGTKKGLVFYLNEKQIFLITERTPGWSEDQLNALHKILPEKI
jgi:hypothetical protein